MGKAKSLQVITEWDAGAALCRAFLKDQATWRAFADKLVDLAVCAGVLPLPLLIATGVLRIRWLADQH
jgi:hypothetical protein